MRYTAPMANKTAYLDSVLRRRSLRSKSVVSNSLVEAFLSEDVYYDTETENAE